MFSPSIRLGCSRGITIAALLMAASIAHGQGEPDRIERADPLDAGARVPAVTHSSALAGYRLLGDDQRVSWQEANERVNRIGGWRAYTREAQQPEPAASTPAPGVPTPPPSHSPGQAHGHHKMH